MKDITLRILSFLHHYKGLSQHKPSFLDGESKSNHVDTLRYACKSSHFHTSNLQVSNDVFTQLKEAVDVANVMEELGYDCIIDATRCKDIFSLFLSIQIANSFQDN